MPFRALKARFVDTRILTLSSKQADASRAMGHLGVPDGLPARLRRSIASQVEGAMNRLAPAVERRV